MKKTIACVLTLIFVFQMPAIGAVAAVPATLDEIADEYIWVEEVDGETIYSNLLNFALRAKEVFPDVADLELAEYLIEYTGLFYTGVSDEEKLEVLTFEEIRISSNLYCVSENGMSEIDSIGLLPSYATLQESEWESENGYLMITTSCGVGAKKDNGDVPYVLSAKAEWIREPAIRLRDTFAITYGGVFDDSYDITATFYHEELCATCGNTPIMNEREVFGPDTDGVSRYKETSSNIELDFSQDYAIGMKFPVTRIGCYHYLSSDSATPTNCAACSDMYVTLKFRVLISGTSQAKAAYAHTRISANVSIGATFDGETIKPEITVGVAALPKLYLANPITLRYI